jgi:hypothetical protein
MGQTCCGGRANASGAPRPIDKVVADVDSRGLWGGALAHSMKQALATLNRMSRHEGRDLEMFGQATARNILDFKKKNQEIAAKIWEKCPFVVRGSLRARAAATESERAAQTTSTATAS